MYDHNVFAVLTAYDERNMASSAFHLKHNTRWLRKAESGVAKEPTIGSREPTPAPFASGSEQQAAIDRLVITFDQLQEGLYSGIQLGTDPKTSHVLLGHRGTKGISGRQCSIIVSKELRIWLRDFHSTHGTAVGHDGQNEREVRTKDTWILSSQPGENVKIRFKQTVILAGALAFRIEFPNHVAASPEYLKNLQIFVDQCAIAAKAKAEVLAIEGLDLDTGLATQAATGVPTPGERLIYYKGGCLGSGAFGEVHLMLRARDGVLFAAKTFKPEPNKRKHDHELPLWLMKIRREFTLMRDNPHPNVAQVFELREAPEPMIIMVYYPHGNMANAHTFDESQRMSGFGQVLEALSHLHEKGVVHRDLKPENLLVELEPFFKVVITDFGLAKVVVNHNGLHTFCGTPRYLAPEVVPGISSGHGTLADIWSLGVIGIEWMYERLEPPPLPASRPEQTITTVSWHRWIRDWVTRLHATLVTENEGDDQLIYILNHMVKFEAGERWPAKNCLIQGLKRGLFKRRITDGLIVCAHCQDDLEGAAEVTPASPSTKTARRQSSMDPDATVILGNLWDDAKSF